MRILVIIAGAALVSGGCASFSPQYALDPPVQRATPQYPVRVAVTPITIAKQHSQGGLNNLKLDGEAFSALLARQLEGRRVFEVQRPVAEEYKKCTATKLQQLRTQGYDALLLCDVVDIQGGRGANRTEEAANAIAPLGALSLAALGATVLVEGAGRAQPSSYYAYTTLRCKVVSTGDGRTLWYGETSVMAFESSGWRDPVLNLSFKNATENLIRDMENANFIVNP